MQIKIRKYILFFCLLISIKIFSQAPNYINYQAIARDGLGNVVTTAIGVKFQIYQGSASGTLVYEETNSATPSSVGIFTLHIGAGSPVVGSFNAINWANGPYYLQVGIDPSGGTSYSSVGSSQLVSVPYALYAEKTSAPVLNVTPTSTSNVLSINGSTVNIPDATGSSSTPTLIGTSPITVTPVPAIGTPTAYVISTASVPSVSSPTLQINSPHSITTLGPNSYSITVAPTSITGAGVASVTGTYPNYNIAVPAPSLSINGNTITITTGTAVSTQTLAMPSPSLGYNTSTLTSTPGGTLVLGTQSVNLSSWDLFGNAGTVAGNHFLGTTDAQGFVIRTNNIDRIGVNTSTIAANGGVVIGGNVNTTSLGKDLTLQGTLSGSSDLTYGHLALRGGGFTANVPQAFMTFNNGLGSRLALIGDFNNTDDDLHIMSGKGLRLGAGNTFTNTNLFIESSNGKVGIGTGVNIPSYRLHVLETNLTSAAIGAINTYTSTNAGSAMGVYGESNNSSTSSAGVYGQHNGGGNGVTGISNTSTFANTAGVYGYAIGTNSTNVSIQADVVNGNSTGLFVNGFPTHTGISLNVLKAGPSGIAGKFVLNNTSNTSEAVLVNTNGIGSALHLINTSVAAGSAAGQRSALWLEEGHIRTSQAVKPTIALASALTGGASCSINGPGTDVAGEILFNTGTVSGTSPFNLVTVSFNKAYTSTPAVILTPRNSTAATLQYYVAPTLTGFTIISVNTPSSFSNYQFYYFVIER